MPTRSYPSPSSRAGSDETLTAGARPTRHMAAAAAVFLAAILLPVTAAHAAVRITLHERPLLAEARASRAARLPGDLEVASKRAVEAAPASEPAATFWFVPRFLVDTTTAGDTTLFGVRNEGESSIELTVQYYDVFFSLQRTDTFEVNAHGILPVNVRDVAGLAVDPDGFARGFVRINPNGPISVDYFQVDTSDNFASANTAFTTTADFCTEWQVRFLSFDPQGSIVSVLVNGPHGSDSTDPPTVVGDVYDEAGAFINSFTIRTDQWVFDIAVLDFVLGGVHAGSVELMIDATFSPSGLATVAHSAAGRFSVGLQGVCKDAPEP